MQNDKAQDYAEMMFSIYVYKRLTTARWHVLRNWWYERQATRWFKVMSAMIKERMARHGLS